MTKVYIVTEGAYSSYRIVSVHTDRNAAMQAAAKLNGNQVDRYGAAQAEEWTLDESTTPEAVTRFAYSESISGKRLTLSPTMAGACPPRSQYGLSDRYCGVVAAKSAAAAKKIAAEQIAIARAQKEGIA